MYQKLISHRNRAAIVILIDGSVSMKKWTKIKEMPIRKSEVAAMVANFIIDELLVRATRNHEVRNYYDIAAIGYSGNGIESLLPGDGDGFTAIDRLAEYTPQLKHHFIDHKTPDNRYINASFMLHPWVEPTAVGSTPMYDALVHVKDLVSQWCANPDNQDSFPPLVFHITDGDCGDACDNDMLDIAERLTNTHTNDGNTLFINVHLSSSDDSGNYCEIFPAEKTFYTDDPDRMLLFRMSSAIPKSLEPAISDMLHRRYRGTYRAVAFNASVCEILSVINIGSESINRYHN